MTLKKLIHTLIPYSWLIIAVFGLAAYLSFRPAVSLLGSIKTSMNDLIPKHYPTILTADEINKKFTAEGGGGGDLIVVIDSPDAIGNFKALNDLVAHIQKRSEVKNVEYTKKMDDFFDKYKLLYMDLADIKEVRRRLDSRIQKEKLRGLYIDLEDGEKKELINFDDLLEKYRTETKKGVDPHYFANPDHTAYAFWIHPVSTDTSLKFFKKFLTLMESHIGKFPLASYHPDLKLYYAGSIKTRVNEYVSLIHDLTKAGIVSTLGVFALLFIYFRKIAGVILTFIPVFAGIIYGFAISSFFIPNLNIVTSFLFSILLGLGIDVGIHMFSRYLEDRAHGLPVEEAVTNILLRTGRSSSVAVATTVVIFFILVINDFRGFSEFGWIAGIGLLLTLITYIVLYPALLVVAEKLKWLRITPSSPNDFIARRLGQLDRFPGARKVATTCFILMGASIAALPLVGFEWNFGILKSQVPETRMAEAKLKEIKPRVNRPAAVIIGSEAEAMAIKDLIEAKKKNDPTPTIDYFRSVHDLYPHNQEEKLQVWKEIDRLLDDDALNFVKGEKKEEIEKFRKMIRDTPILPEKDVPREYIEPFYGKGAHTHEQMGFIYPLPDLELDDGRNAMAFYDDVHHIKTQAKDYYATSQALVFADVLKTLFKDSRRAIALAILTMVLLIYWDLRHFKESAIVLLALAFGVVGMGGVMALLGLKLNFYNMICIPIVIGLGEDNSVHLVHRFKEMGESSVMGPLTSSGMAAATSSLTTMVGFGGLLFAHHPGLNSIGWLAVAGITTCLIASLVFLPALLEGYKKRS